MARSRLLLGVLYAVVIGEVLLWLVGAVVFYLVGRLTSYHHLDGGGPIGYVLVSLLWAVGAGVVSLRRADLAELRDAVRVLARGGPAVLLATLWPVQAVLLAVHAARTPGLSRGWRAGLTAGGLAVLIGGSAWGLAAVSTGLHR
ncbi:hypothetical protein [Kitasatospora sp. LaBMicrA B282]|uniref:hypothetical protein n=1 Tax=Kitasatospora sp. LaBMicrA B282 TaxID=3420949 RepID=UPI003D13290D